MSDEKDYQQMSPEEKLVQDHVFGDIWFNRPIIILKNSLFGTIVTSPSDPLKHLKTAMRVVSGACGNQANFVVMGSKAGDAFFGADC
jgi:hypothetical protein